MKQEFDAVIQQPGNVNGAYIEPPFDVEKVFGAKRVKVLATFDGEPYRGSLVRMGGCYMLGMTQEIRKKIGKDHGDLVRVTIEKDEEERSVVIPEDFQTLLEQEEEARTTFQKLSYTDKKLYVTWITDAKKEETRKERLVKSIEKLSQGQKLR